MHRDDERVPGGARHGNGGIVLMKNPASCLPGCLRRAATKIRIATFLLMVATVWNVLFPVPAFSERADSLLCVTRDVGKYAVEEVRPAVEACPRRDRLSLLIKVAEILIDPSRGVGANRVDPGAFMRYYIFQKVGIGFFVTLGLSARQASVLKEWHAKFMGESPAQVFFAPSADDVIRARAAFGCSHYSRSFMAVVKALGLIDTPSDLRYVVSSKADDYNRALEKKDTGMTINGHQFVLARVDAKWIAINTSKAEWRAMPEGFTPDSVHPPTNVPVQFQSYPGVTFLLRKVGRDYDDDCEDGSLRALMNISRSGDAGDSDFRWDRYVDPEEGRPDP